ncbi:MAG: hypothetical protein ACI9JN_001639, partial [Bacteroidia bacterium]
MNYMMSRTLILLLLSFVYAQTLAQKAEVPVGEWRIHLPYNAVNSIAETPTYIYVGAERGFYSFHKKSGEMELYSKVNGFSGVEVQLLKYHTGLDLLVIAYENTDIDILQGNSIFNISDILRKSILGQKTINDIHFEGNQAYLSCSFGIVIIDLETKAVSDSYLNIGPAGVSTPINSLTFYKDSIFAGTSIGILKAPVTGLNLSDFNSWDGPISMRDPRDPASPGIDSTKARLLRVFRDKLYCEVDQRLRVYDGNMWIFKGDTIPQFKRDTRSIEICHGNLVYVQVPLRPEISPGITVIDANGNERFIKENVNNFAILDVESSIWTGGDFTGLVKINKNGQYSFTKPNGPQRSTAFSMTPIGNQMWVAGGGTSAQWNPIFSNAGFYIFEAGIWKPRLKIPEIEFAYDILTIAADPSGSEVFVGTHGFGLIHLRNNQLVDLYTDQNSILTKSGGGFVQADGLAYDNDGNVWITNYDSDKPLKVRTPEGKWNGFELPSLRPTEIIVDDFNQKWMITKDFSTGIIVFRETEGVLSTTNEILSLQNSVGRGSLPSNEVNALVLDHNGQIWVGTSEGLAVFYNPGGIFEREQDREAKRFIIDDGKDVGYLLGSEVINDIQVDGANRKWVATTTGAWLIAADGSEVIQHFTVENSPLLSNVVNCVGILPKTGEVFFGTSKGLVSYRGDATGANNFHGKVNIFPNPVRPDYDGPITINGLPDNATVKITDISGRVVYEMISNGGTAVWDGNNFDGQRAKTG